MWRKSKSGFPETKSVAINTVLPLPRSTWSQIITRGMFCCQQMKNNGQIIYVNRCLTMANLFDDVENSTSLRWVVVGVIRSPRCVGVSGFLREESEESEVAVCHVLILGARQKTTHDRKDRVTVHDHCRTQHIRQIMQFQPSQTFNQIFVCTASICSIWRRTYMSGGCNINTIYLTNMYLDNSFNEKLLL